MRKTQENKFQVGDQVIAEIDGEWFEAEVTSAHQPDENSHWIWTYGIYVSDKEFNNPYRERDSYWKYEDQLQRI